MSLSLRCVELEAGAFRLRIDAELGARVTGLYGPSGAGKTTVLEIVAGLRRPQRGVVALDGRALTDVERGLHVPPWRRRIGYVPQDAALFPHLSVRANLTYGQPPGARPSELARVADVLELAAVIDRRPATLSGGEKQRVALGRALLAEPSLLLMDEPLSGLDSLLKERVLPYLLRVRDEFEVPMIHVAHDARELEATCDEVLVLVAGECVRRGEPRSVLRPEPSIERDGPG